MSVTPESGLLYYRARYYEARTGRFLQEDPVESFNPYSYGNNGPVNWTDPFGLDAAAQAKRNRAASEAQIAWARSPAGKQYYENAWRAHEQWQRTRKGLNRRADEQWEERFGTLEEIDRQEFGEYLRSLPEEEKIRAIAERWVEKNPVGPCGCTVGTRPCDVTTLYQKVDRAGRHLKYGVTKNPASRYTAAELRGGRLRNIAKGPREQMLELEHKLHETLPIGPEEGQGAYILKQIEQGLIPPPYPW